jgi:hypothetical protein
MAPGGEPTTVVVSVRRYVCTACGAVITVAPRGVIFRRHYAAAAITLAMALFGVDHRSVAAVRSAVSPWRIVGHAAAGTWITFRRWIRAVRERRLFATIRGAPRRAAARRVAERVAQVAAALAPPALRRLPMSAQAFHGGLRMA